MKETILRKRLVSEGLPENYAKFLTDIGYVYHHSFGQWMDQSVECHPKYWYEEVSAHVLSNEELKEQSCLFTEWVRENGYMDGKDENGVFWMNKEVKRYSTKELYEKYTAIGK